MNSIYKQADALPYLSVRMCPHCEQLIEKGQNVCPLCKYNFLTNDIVPKENEGNQEEPKNLENERFGEEQEKEESSSEEVSNETESNEKVNADNQEVVNNSHKNVSYCVHCGFKIQPGQRFCGKCGLPVEQFNDRKICFSCHEQIESSLAFCPYCGAKQNAQEQPQNQETVQNEEKTTVTSVQETTTASSALSGIVANQEEKNEPKKTKKKANPKKVKKIVFSSIQLFICLVVVAVMILFPLYSKEPFYNIIMKTIKGESEETFITGLGFIKVLLNGFSIEASLFKNGDDLVFFSKITDWILGVIHKTPDLATEVKVAYIATSVIYFSLAFALVLLFFASIISIFVKKPLEGKLLVFLMIVEIFASLIIYPSRFLGLFKGYDTWLIYVLALTFVFWFVVKIAFLKDVKELNANRKTPKKKRKADDYDLDY